MSVLLLILASFLSGVVAALGLGGGSVLLIFLRMVKQTPQLQAQGINLAFFIPVGIVSVLIHSKNKLICWKDVFWCYPTGFLGVLAAGILAQKIEQNLLPKIFACLLLVIGVKEIWAGLRNTDKIDDWRKHPRHKG